MSLSAQQREELRERIDARRRAIVGTVCPLELGSTTGYRRGCRCRDCRDATNASRQARRLRAKAAA